MRKKNIQALQWCLGNLKPMCFIPLSLSLFLSWRAIAKIQAVGRGRRLVFFAGFQGRSGRGAGL